MPFGMMGSPHGGGYPGRRPEQAPEPPRRPKQKDLDAPRISGRQYSELSEKEKDDAATWQLGPRFRTPGMKPPPSGYFDIPPVPGSDSDVQHSHMGTAAR